MVSVSYCCVRNNHKTSGMHTWLCRLGRVTLLHVSCWLLGMMAMAATSDDKSTKHAFCKPLSTPHLVTCLCPGEAWQFTTQKLTDCRSQLLLLCTYLHFMVGPHFPTAAPSQCLSSMIKGTNAGPFLQDMGLFSWVTLTWGPLISLAKTFLELPCSLSPLLPSSFLLSCTCQDCTWVWKISPLSQHLTFILPSNFLGQSQNQGV